MCVGCMRMLTEFDKTLTASKATTDWHLLEMNKWMNEQKTYWMNENPLMWIIIIIIIYIYKWKWKFTFPQQPMDIPAVTKWDARIPMYSNMLYGGHFNAVITMHVFNLTSGSKTKKRKKQWCNVRIFVLMDFICGHSWRRRASKCLK